MGCSPWGQKESDMAEQPTRSFSFYVLALVGMWKLTASFIDRMEADHRF